MQNTDSNYNRVMLNAILKWYADTGAPRAHFIVDHTMCNLPEAFVQTADDLGHVTLNMAWQATRDMSLDEEGASFKAAIKGFPYSLYVPYAAIMGYITDQGFTIWNYMPTEAEPVEMRREKEVTVDTSYLPQMKTLQLGDTDKETRSNTEKHLQLIHAHRTVKKEQVVVDPKSPSYPFPEDRFQAYNDKQILTLDSNVKDDAVFKGTPGGIEFHSRKPTPRVRPDWLRVIDGGRA